MIEEKELENIFFPKKIRYMELFEEKNMMKHGRNVFQ